MKSTLQYKRLHSYDDQWRNIKINEGFRPRDGDFEHIMFKIKEIVYKKPSKTFYEAFSKELTWILLNKG